MAFRGRSAAAPLKPSLDFEQLNTGEHHSAADRPRPH